MNTPETRLPMRPDASPTEGVGDSSFLPCECGCGRFFKPAKKHQKYFDDNCRKRAWINRNSGAAAISKIRKDHAAILARLDKAETELAAIRRHLEISAGMK